MVFSYILPPDDIKIEGFKNYAGLTAEELTRRAENVLHGFGLSDCKTMKISELSSGMAARTALARTVFYAELLNCDAPRPTLFVLDEPFARLDAETKAAAINVFRKRIEKGAGMIFVTHDADEQTALSADVFICRQPDRGYLWQS